MKGSPVPTSLKPSRTNAIRIQGPRRIIWARAVPALCSRCSALRALLASFHPVSVPVGPRWQRFRRYKILKNLVVVLLRFMRRSAVRQEGPAGLSWTLPLDARPSNHSLALLSRACFLAFRTSARPSIFQAFTFWFLCAWQFCFQRLFLGANGRNQAVPSTLRGEVSSPKYPRSALTSPVLHRTLE